MNTIKYQYRQDYAENNEEWRYPIKDAVGELVRVESDAVPALGEIVIIYPRLEDGTEAEYPHRFRVVNRQWWPDHEGTQSVHVEVDWVGLY